MILAMTMIIITVGIMTTTKTVVSTQEHVTDTKINSEIATQIAKQKSLRKEAFFIHQFLWRVTSL